MTEDLTIEYDLVEHPYQVLVATEAVYQSPPEKWYTLPLADDDCFKGNVTVVFKMTDPPTRGCTGWYTSKKYITFELEEDAVLYRMQLND